MGISCFVAGHSGLVGSSVVAAIGKMAPKYRVITAKHSDLDLTDRDETFKYFEKNQPTHVAVSYTHLTLPTKRIV